MNLPLNSIIVRGDRFVSVKSGKATTTVYAWDSAACDWLMEWHFKSWSLPPPNLYICISRPVSVNWTSQCCECDLNSVTFCVPFYWLFQCLFSRIWISFFGWKEPKKSVSAILQMKSQCDAENIGTSIEIWKKLGVIWHLPVPPVEADKDTNGWIKPDFRDAIFVSWKCSFAQQIEVACRSCSKFWVNGSDPLCVCDIIALRFILHAILQTCTHNERHIKCFVNACFSRNGE